MTSNRFFFNSMKEDLRHKLWMIALSSLGSFLLITVVWLIWWSNQVGMEELLENSRSHMERDKYVFAMIEETISFFRDFVTAMGGIIAIVGAIITGLFGFRYVFHKNMVDAYHSLPVKRRTLFAVGYLDGFLIWLVPFLFFYLPTVAMGAGFLGQLGGTGQEIRAVILTALLTLVALTVAFLLVYSLVLVAVMLSGNILNTLMSMMILGFGGISVFGIGYTFFAVYMKRFYDAWDWSGIAYTSPLFSAPALLFWRADLGGNLPAFWGKLAVSFAVAALLSWCAWLLYKNRASELAEHGIRNKVATSLMKIIVGMVAGMGGWLLFTLLTDNMTIVWGIFGLLLAGIVSMGVLNIIFTMDFKAFFTRKRLMAAVLLASLLICFAFRWDWMGYDDYLPGKKKIAQLGVSVGEFSNRYIDSDAEQSPLQGMEFQDADAIYSYLECAVREETDWDYWLSVPTRVTLNSGRSYYRRYQINKEDKALLWPIVTSQEYLKYAFFLDQEMIKDCKEFQLSRVNQDETFQIREYGPQVFQEIIEAYNQDLMEDPEGVFLGRGRRLACMSFDILDRDGSSPVVRISVYDTMEHTVEALRGAGCEKWISELNPEEFVSVTLNLPYGFDQDMSEEERIANAREYYGVPLQTEEGILPEEAETSYENTQMKVDREYNWSPALEITDPAEIAELCGLVDYAGPSRSDRIFQEGCTEIYGIDKEGSRQRLYLPMGVLPEKYILRFGNCS